MLERRSSISNWGLDTPHRALACLRGGSSQTLLSPQAEIKNPVEEIKAFACLRGGSSQTLLSPQQGSLSLLVDSRRVGVGIMITHNPLHGSGQLEIPLQLLTVVSPRLPVRARRGFFLQREVGHAQRFQVIDVVQKRREPQLPILLCCLTVARSPVKQQSRIESCGSRRFCTTSI